VARCLSDEPFPTGRSEARPVVILLVLLLVPRPLRTRNVMQFQCLGRVSRVLFWAPPFFYRVVFIVFSFGWDRKWDNFFRETKLRRAARGQLLLRSLPRIDPRHACIIPTEHRHQLMLACAGFSGADGPNLAQAVAVALRQSRLHAPTLELVAKAIRA